MNRVLSTSNLHWELQEYCEERKYVPELMNTWEYNCKIGIWHRSGYHYEGHHSFWIDFSRLLETNPGQFRGLKEGRFVYISIPELPKLWEHENYIIQKYSVDFQSFTPREVLIALWGRANPEKRDNEKLTEQELLLADRGSVFHYLHNRAIKTSFHEFPILNSYAYNKHHGVQAMEKVLESLIQRKN